MAAAVASPAALFVLGMGGRVSCSSSTSSSKLAAKLGRWKVTRAAAIDSAAAYPEVTWQIAVGALAGVTPFIVAGIEFSKRIVAQRKCGVCGGSGLVKREKYYFRCPNCGGFLPWQSWKRFFTG